MSDPTSSPTSAGTADEPRIPLPRFNIAVLRLDLDGHVRFSNGVLERELGRIGGWLMGKPLADVVDERCLGKVRDLLTIDDAAAPAAFELTFGRGRDAAVSAAFQVVRDDQGIWLVRLPVDAASGELRDELFRINTDLVGSERELSRRNRDLSRAFEQLKEQKEELEQQTEQLSEQAIELEMQKEELEAQKVEIERQKEELEQRAASLADAHRRAEAQANEYRQVSDLLHEANEKLEERAKALSEATEAKSRFLATMSHELRTPLNAVLGYSGLLRDGVYGPMTQAQERAILNIVRRAKDLQLLIDDVLDLSKIEAGRMELRYEDFDPRVILSEVEETIAPLASEKQLTIRSRVTGLVSVRLDRTKYKQILTNLASNAVKFTPAKGTVELVVEPGADGAHFVTHVTDTGIGIAEENVERIFESFRQVEDGTTRRFQGTGLGLAIARRLTELMNGNIRVTSTLGKGATFSVILPVAFEQPQAVDAVPTADLVGAESDPVILAIDDDPEVIMLLRDSLGPAHFRVVGALDANRGIELARLLQPFAITLDIMMPEKDGWEALKELKADPELRDIPVLIMSIVSERALGFSLGVTDYLVKPVDRKVLIEVLERLRDRKPGRVALVVDEDGDARELLKDLLESLEVQVHCVKGGAEALEALDHEVPTLLFLSVTLPEDEVAAIVARVQSERHAGRTRTILVSRSDERHDQRDWLRRAATAVIDKSDLQRERDEMLQHLRRLLDEMGSRSAGR